MKRNYDLFEEGFNEDRVAMKHEARRANMKAEKELRQFNTDKFSMKASKSFKAAKRNIKLIDFNLYNEED